MSAYSTIKITRSTARRLILDYIATGLGDEELKFLCDHLIEHKLFNSYIVGRRTTMTESCKPSSRSLPLDDAKFLRDILQKPQDALTGIEFMQLWQLANDGLNARLGAPRGGLTACIDEAMQAVRDARGIGGHS